MSYASTVHAKAVELAKDTYRITGAAGSGHPSSGASLVHLLTILLEEHLRFEPANPGHPSSDRLVLSEGHAVPVVYAAMARLGIHYVDSEGRSRPMTLDVASTLREIDSPVDGHPNPALGFAIFDAATGSLGQGLSVAAGLAAAARLDGLERRVYCVIGDGEAREGQVWEAVDFLRDQRLHAVCPIFNCNAYAQTDRVSPQQSAEVLAAKLHAAGFDVHRIDGHDPEAIREALDAHVQRSAQTDQPPVAVVAETVKGWGAASQQGNGHHGSAPTGDALEQTLQELDTTGKQMGATALVSLKRGLLPGRKPQKPDVRPPLGFEATMRELGAADALASGKMATRKAYGYALRALGHRHPGVVALDADVQGSTGAATFAKDPDLRDRFVECRIAEQNMVSVALGLAAGGRTPLVSTFGKFLVRAYDQIEMAVLSGKPFTLVGSHAGCTLGPDGPSQMGLSDVAWFRAFTTMRTPGIDGPAFHVLTPADAYACHALVQQAAEHDGFVYLRTMRPDTEFLYSDRTEFTLGGHEVVVEGRDLLICAQGYMVHEANRALQVLDDAGIDATLVDLYSLPFDQEAIADLANSNGGKVLTLEDNYGNSMGSAVADALSAEGDEFEVKQMHVTRMPKSGKSADDILKYVGLTADDIAREAMALLQVEAVG